MSLICKKINLILIQSWVGVRNAYSDIGSQYIILIFTVLFFRIDYKLSSETFLIDYFFVSILYRKFSEFLLKVNCFSVNVTRFLELNNLLHIAATIRGDLHRALANNLGFSIPCICATVQCATLGYAFSTNCHQCTAVDSSQSFPGYVLALPLLLHFTHFQTSSQEVPYS